jgi:hypothetical protein
LMLQLRSLPHSKDLSEAILFSGRIPGGKTTKRYGAKPGRMLAWQRTLWLWLEGGGDGV